MVTYSQTIDKVSCDLKSPFNREIRISREFAIIITVFYLLRQHWKKCYISRYSKWRCIGFQNGIVFFDHFDEGRCVKLQNVQQRKHKHKQKTEKHRNVLHKKRRKKEMRIAACSSAWRDQIMGLNYGLFSSYLLLSPKQSHDESSRYDSAISKECAHWLINKSHLLRFSGGFLWVSRAFNT